MKWYELKNKNEKETEIYLFNEIGAWGENAGDFIKAFKTIKADKVILHINSPGGNVFDGLAIYNVLKESGKKVTVRIEGLAASIASVIAMSGDEIIMSKASMLMIHNPFGSVSGDSERLRKMAETMDMVKEQIVNIYAEKTKLEQEEIKSMMSAETWLTSQTAKKKGFCDKISDNLKISAFVDMDKYKFQNQAIFETYKQNIKEEKEENMDIKAIATILGVNESNVENSIKGMIAENTELKNKVKEMKKKINENIVDLAISEKKLTPSQREFALNLLDKSEELFNEFLRNSNPGRPEISSLPDIDNSIDSEGKKLSYEDLMNNKELHDSTLRDNPKLYTQLYNKYLGGM